MVGDFGKFSGSFWHFFHCIQNGSGFRACCLGHLRVQGFSVCLALHCIAMIDYSRTRAHADHPLVALIIVIVTVAMGIIIVIFIAVAYASQIILGFFRCMHACRYVYIYIYIHIYMRTILAVCTALQLFIVMGRLERRF